MHYKFLQTETIVDIKGKRSELKMSDYKIIEAINFKEFNTNENGKKKKKKHKNSSK